LLELALNCDPPFLQIAQQEDSQKENGMDAEGEIRIHC
jgi:hypothetical protein